jgi:hypothetical protein
VSSGGNKELFLKFFDRLHRSSGHNDGPTLRDEMTKVRRSGIK